MTIEVLHGDCLEHMAAMASAGRTFDSIVTDPPYGLGFMGKHWDAPDNVAFRPETWRLALDVLEPGGMMACFGGSRTQHRMACAIEDAGFEIRDCALWLYGSGFPKSKALLKPAYEPIILARKPGPLRMLNIDSCRVPTNGEQPRGSGDRRGGNIYAQDEWTQTQMRNGGNVTPESGRWPASILHDGSDEVLEAFAAFGVSKSSGGGMRNGDKFGGGFAPPGVRNIGLGDTGTAARFFYCAKSSKAERAGSKHPTVKPLALMRWVTRLITPPGGTVLDPFAGTGTTLRAAMDEGFNAVGVESEAEYIADIHSRLDLTLEAAE